MRALPRISDAIGISRTAELQKAWRTVEGVVIQNPDACVPLETVIQITIEHLELCKLQLETMTCCFFWAHIHATWRAVNVPGTVIPCEIYNGESVTNHGVPIFLRTAK